MIQTIKNIIADYFIEWALKLYDGELKLSLAQWIAKEFPKRLSTPPQSEEELDQ